MCFNLLPVHFKYTTLLHWVFMQLSVPTGITHISQRTSTRDRMPWGDSPGATPRGRAVPRDWSSCAGTALPRNSNPLLWAGRRQQSLLRPNLPCCPGFQLQAQLCPKLQCKGRHWRKPLLLQIPACPSPHQFCTGLWAPSPTQIGVCSLQGWGYLPTSYTIHYTALLSFRRIHVLKNLEQPCCLNGLTLSKVPGDPLPLSFYELFTQHPILIPTQPSQLMQVF